MAEEITPDAGGSDLWTKIQTVNSLLQAQEPENISVDSYGGYTGYKPQYIKDAMNEVFGPDGWGYDEISSEIHTTEGRNGKSLLVVAKVEVWIEGVKRRPKAWGQCLVTNNAIGDAQKGADTDGAKKGLSDFSIGNRAFQGKLSKEDAEEWKRQQEEQAKARTNGRRIGNAQTNNQRAASAGQGAANNRQAPAPASGNSATAPRSAAPTSAPRPAATTNAPRPAPADDPDLNQIPSSGKLRARVDNGTYRGDDGKSLEWKEVLSAVFAPEINAQRTTVDKLLKAEMGPQSCKRVYDYLERLNAA